ncbi:ribosomal protein S18-alanine N-acetyltransferase [Neptunomonas concharum]|uniref:[Ribosomal protein bS18]-alanine N-acetyltransferase n=1 Tax=Neptunomonas concharum TaxID=1031538 RepID=A0A5P1R7W9_9GAMM|nr:ribosomal protein S18-alanine N-acetyltransferase [Neptunomonas concharum]QEQ95698.1 ribosomal-protein-alanine N-acetyltransferase [Neptunomonas concharum]
MSELRRLTVSDGDALFSLETLSFPSDAWSRSQLEQQLTDARSTNLGVCVAGNLAGFVLAKSLFDESELYQIAVSPDQQGQGMAQLLLNALVAELKREGIARVMLEVRASNLRAIDLYTRFGFTVDGRRKDYYWIECGREDALLLSYQVNR